MAKEAKKDVMKEDFAIELAKRQKEISVAEFFTKNRHLLGFDNKRKALLMTVKEAVDNSLDACEEARIQPEISVELIEMGEFKYKVVIEDNGPGIVKKQIPNIFAKLLYGSKFHTMKQARGQQGIGISAAVLYGQLTTGKPARITSRISKKEPAHYYELSIDTHTNKPVIAKEDQIDWPKEHGTRVEIDLEGDYMKGNQSVDEYLKQTAVINPHVTIIYTNPKSEQIIYARGTETLPPESSAIKPHPYGIELGMLIDKLRYTEARTLQAFLTSEFSRVGPGTAKDICEAAALLPNTKPLDVSRDMAEKLLSGMQKTKIIAPPTDCLSPIGKELLEKGLRKEIRAEFYCSTSRPPAVYRGNPFIMEVGVAYGGEIPKESRANVLRFANRVPLLYQEGACAMTNSIAETNWKTYGLSQSGESVPVGPVVILIHMASVWVPFTSESKEAIAHYQEIIKEVKLALQECGRQLGTYVKKKYRISEQMERANMFEKYIPEIADSLSSLSGEKKEKILAGLQKMLVKPEIKKEIIEDDEDAKQYRMEFKKSSEELEKNEESSDEEEENPDKKEKKKK
jgi:DNA topoisomerase VI subunit B